MNGVAKACEILLNAMNKLNLFVPTRRKEKSSTNSSKTPRISFCRCINIFAACQEKSLFNLLKYSMETGLIRFST